MYFEMLLMNGIDDTSESVRLSMSQSHIGHCSEIYTDNTGIQNQAGISTAWLVISVRG